jgi:hypothetical protein
MISPIKGVIIMDIFKQVNEQLERGSTLNSLGASVGAGPDQVKQLVEMAMPAMLQAMGRNAASDDGRKSLANALNQHRDDDVSDLERFLGRVDTQDGSKVLGHLFGGGNQKVQTNLAAKTGLDLGQVAGLLTRLAPLLLGALGQETKQNRVEESGLAGFLGKILGQTAGNDTKGMLSQLLDMGDDGDEPDGVGSLLGSLFKKR